MGKVSTEHFFTGTTTGIATYDQDKTILGSGSVSPVLFQQSGGAAGPIPIGFARGNEVANPYAMGYPHVISITPTLDWIFFADLTTAATTRRVIAYTYDKTTQTFVWKGSILLTYPTTGNETIRALRVARHMYTTGTASASGTAVTGSNTTWQTARYAVGARIGFGSTDPTQITTWYYITAITNNTSITINASAGTVVDGPYVIEELRVFTLTTNATLANGGLYVTKGINFDDFSAVGTVIPAGVTTDNIKAVYFLKDNGGGLIQIAAGIGYTDPTSDTSHTIYCLTQDVDATHCRVYKYNVRAALSLTAGVDTANGFLLRTARSQAVTGNISQTNNGRVATTNHGPGSGVPSIYFVTATRVYRIPLNLIYDTSASFIADGMVEVPTGTANTFAASGALSSIEYSSIMDRFIITTSATARQYVTRYQTQGDPFDHVFMIDTKQIDQSTADTGITPYPNLQGVTISVWSEAGMCYICRNGTTSLNLHVYAVPLSVQWDYAAASNQRIITPRMATPNASQLYRVYVNEAKIMGSDNLGVPPEPYRIYVRTSGINDNSGAWTAVPKTGDLDGVTPGDYVQFAFEFRMLGITCVPSKIYSVAVVYEDDATDSHFQPSAGQTVAASTQFAWRHATAFGGSVPALRVRLYDAVSSALLVDDNTTSPVGTWERSTNGGSSYSAWTNADKGNETTYIRYTPASMGSNLTVKAVLTLA